jgi:predicted branched-subunit amino acid permease
MSTHIPATDAAHGPAETPRADPRRAAREGAWAMIPLIAGYLPFALVIGAVCAEHGEPLAAWAGSWLIYGGSAHLATIRTLDKAGLAVAVLTGLAINARLVVYSASLARHWTGQPRWFRFAAAGLIIDPTWAAAERHAERERDPVAQRQFFLGAGLTLGVAWSGAIAVGALAGARLGWLDVDVVAPLCLIALIGQSIRSRSERAVVVAATTVAVLTRNLPAGSGLLLAIGAGVAAGALAQRGAR